MALRQTTGFVESLLGLIGLNGTVPDFSTPRRRQKTLAVNIPHRCSNGPLHLLIDIEPVSATGSSEPARGIKVEGEGEWSEADQKTVRGGLLKKSRRLEGPQGRGRRTAPDLSGPDRRSGRCRPGRIRGRLGRKYASIAPAWRRAREEVTPFFAFPPAVRKIIYTTNAIESLNRMRRENSVPHCFLTLHIPKVDQNPKLIPDRGGRHKADLAAAGCHTPILPTNPSNVFHLCAMCRPFRAHLRYGTQIVKAAPGWLGLLHSKAAEGKMRKQKPIRPVQTGHDRVAAFQSCERDAARENGYA